MFQRKRLSLARMRAGLTMKKLAEQAGVAVDTVRRIERGDSVPDEITITKLSGILGFPLDFFFGEEPEEVDLGAVSFRSFSKMSAKQRDAAIAAGSLGLLLNRWVESHFDLPRAELLDLSHETDPEVAAIFLRQHWGIGEQPIGSLLALLETKGLRLFSLSENTASVNAFSFWRDGKPFIFLNNFKTAESSNFDAAHELGHLVMHKHGDPKDTRSAEREANRFASAFLLPAKDVRARMPREVSVETIIMSKSRWRVSAMALAHRLNDLGLLSEWRYNSVCIELTRRGYRTSEPIGIGRETSVVWKKVLTHLWAERITKADIANELHIPVNELEGLIWSLTGGESGRPSTTGAALRAV